jgi:hypothetical protein
MRTLAERRARCVAFAVVAREAQDHRSINGSDDGNVLCVRTPRARA